MHLLLSYPPSSLSLRCQSFFISSDWFHTSPSDILFPLTSEIPFPSVPVPSLLPPFLSPLPCPSSHHPSMTHTHYLSPFSPSLPLSLSHRPLTTPPIHHHHQHPLFSSPTPSGETPTGLVWSTRHDRAGSSGRGNEGTHPLAQRHATQGTCIHSLNRKQSYVFCILYSVLHWCWAFNFV